MQKCNQKVIESTIVSQNESTSESSVQFESQYHNTKDEILMRPRSLFIVVCFIVRSVFRPKKRPFYGGASDTAHNRQLVLVFGGL